MLRIFLCPVRIFCQKLFFLIDMHYKTMDQSEMSALPAGWLTENPNINVPLCWRLHRRKNPSYICRSPWSWNLLKWNKINEVVYMFRFSGLKVWKEYTGFHSQRMKYVKENFTAYERNCGKVIFSVCLSVILSTGVGVGVVPCGHCPWFTVHRPWAVRILLESFLV